MTHLKSWRLGVHNLCFQHEKVLIQIDFEGQCSDVPAPAWPGFRQLRLEEIVSQAKSQKLGLAWPGFGPGWDFLLIYNFAGFDYEINVKNRFIICLTLIHSFLSARHPKSCKKHAKLQ